MVQEPISQADINFKDIALNAMLIPAEPNNPMYEGLLNENGQISLAAAVYLSLQQILNIKADPGGGGTGTITGGQIIGTSGTNIYAGEEAGKMKFKNIRPATPKLLITEDENGNIVFDVDVSSVLTNYAPLENGLIPTRLIPERETIEHWGTVNSEAEMLGLISAHPTVSIGDTVIRGDLNQPDGEEWVVRGSNPAVLSSWQARKDTIAGVTAIVKASGAAGLTGTVIIDKFFVELGNVPDIDATNPANIQWNGTYAPWSLEQKIEALIPKIKALTGDIVAGADGAAVIQDAKLLNKHFAPEIKPGLLSELPQGISADRSSFVKVLTGLYAQTEPKTTADYTSFSSTRSVTMSQGADKVITVLITGTMTLAFSGLGTSHDTPPLREKIYIIVNETTSDKTVNMPVCVNMRLPTQFIIPGGKIAIVSWLYTGRRSSTDITLSADKHILGNYNIQD